MRISNEAITGRCRMESAAFERSLTVAGIDADQMSRVFRADSDRTDWRAIADRGPVRMSTSIAELNTNDSTLEAVEEDVLNGGVARLASNQPGEIKLTPSHDVNDRMLPEPLNLLFAQQWARHGLFPLHAAALRWEGQGILVLGPQGAGKSSLILAALNQGARVISDDWLLVGQHQGQARAERLREFLMFRPGSSWDRFGQRFSDTQAVHRSSDGRWVHCIDERNPQFPVWTELDQCLLLQSPDGQRSQQTSISALHDAALLGHLLDGAMPLLMTQRFNLERAVLFDAFKALIKGVSSRAAVTGSDLLDDPRSVLDRLLIRD